MRSLLNIDPVISQLYNDFAFLIGGASEVCEKIAESIGQLAADYKFSDQIIGSNFPGQPIMIANTLLGFIKQPEERSPSIMASTVKFGRENIEFEAV